MYERRERKKIRYRDLEYLLLISLEGDAAERTPRASVEDNQSSLAITCRGEGGRGTMSIKEVAIREGRTNSNERRRRVLGFESGVVGLYRLELLRSELASDAFLEI